MSVFRDLYGKPFSQPQHVLVDDHGVVHEFGERPVLYHSGMIMLSHDVAATRDIPKGEAPFVWMDDKNEDVWIHTAPIGWKVAKRDTLEVVGEIVSPLTTPPPNWPDPPPPGWRPDLPGRKTGKRKGKKP